MSGQDFKQWAEAFDAAPVDEDGDSAIRDLAWRGMLACVEKAEVVPGDIEDAAREIATGLAWAAFWPSLAAVIWRLAA